jgi:hypothetical protein
MTVTLILALPPKFFFWKISHILTTSIVQGTFARYVKDYYIGKFGSSVASYDQQYLKNTIPAESCKC